MIITWKITIS